MWETRKADLRRTIRQQLKAMPEDKRARFDKQIADCVLHLPEISAADTVLAYASLPWETGTDEILKALWERGTAVYLPKVEGATITFFRTRSKKDLKEGAFHIMEPTDGCRSMEEDAAVSETCRETLFRAPILIPGMGFTEDGRRLGKGGGFYDRFLEAQSGHAAIALAYELQIMNALPVEPHDKSAAMIVTERRVIRCERADCRMREEQPC